MPVSLEAVLAASLPEAASEVEEAAVEPQAARLSVRAAARTVEISFFMVVISFLLRLFFRFVFVLNYVVVFPQTAQHIRTPGCLQRGLYFIGNPPFLPDKRGDKIFI